MWFNSLAQHRLNNEMLVQIIELRFPYIDYYLLNINYITYLAVYKSMLAINN